MDGRTVIARDRGRRPPGARQPKTTADLSKRIRRPSQRRLR
jgi:hypothetical protein